MENRKKPAISDGLSCYYLKKLDFCCLFAAFTFALAARTLTLRVAGFLARTFAVIVFAFVAFSLFSFGLLGRAAALGYAFIRDLIVVLFAKI